MVRLGEWNDVFIFHLFNGSLKVHKCMKKFASLGKRLHMDFVKLTWMALLIIVTMYLRSFDDSGGHAVGCS
ncbi:hypothetical protein C5167_032150 [Papaver somniferum]|uniref:Uncharacterized protein n=1 Tax=Papaver somniferum TaxID=3469 RepID=A0A4Y7K6R8_PAPSO|nr:hypothetical protein C5167_032150 [Papaver somniferum]